MRWIDGWWIGGPCALSEEEFVDDYEGVYYDQWYPHQCPHTRYQIDHLRLHTRRILRSAKAGRLRDRAPSDPREKSVFG